MFLLLIIYPSGHQMPMSKHENQAIVVAPDVHATAIIDTQDLSNSLVDSSNKGI